MKLKDLLLVLMVVIIWGVNFSIIKIGLEELPPLLFSALRFAVVAIPAVFFIPFPKTSVWNVIGVGVFIPPLPLLVLSYFTETQEPLQLVLSMTGESWASLAYVSYISTLVAFAAWGWLLTTHSAATVTPFALLIPVVGIITSSILLNENMNRLEIVGALFIMLGLLLCVVGNKVFIKPQRA